MKQNNYYLVFFLLMFFGQMQAGIYPNYTQNISVPNLNNNGQSGTGGGTITISNDVLTIDITATWASLSYLKIGVVANLTISPALPNMELGKLSSAPGSLLANFAAKIENNTLIFYLTNSPTQSYGCYFRFTKNLACDTAYTWYLDDDLDGLGDPSIFIVQQCTKPNGNYVRDNTDNCPMIPGTNANCSSLEPVIVNRNYIKNITYKVPTGTSILAPTISQANQNITYFDGLGRPVQKTEYQYSASGKDIVTPIEYDAFGRQTKEYLPYASSQNNLNYIEPSVLISNLITQYQANYGAANTNPFSEKKFEDSPLSRILQQGAPGNDWSVINNHTIKMDYQTNAASEVKFFKATTAWSATLGLYDTALGNAGGTVFYATNQLYKTITYDENWVSGKNNTTEEFKNKEGQVVLKRTYANYENPTLLEVKHDTYYVYDNYGNLTYVIPPKADGSITAAVLNDLCYQYKYDYRNRLVEKKLPGKQWEFIVYDKLDRVVATGPVASPFSDLTSAGWSVTKYDALNRPIITAWLPSATLTPAVRKTLQDAQNGYTSNFSETKIATATNTVVPATTGVAFRYSNAAWPTTGYHVLTVNYYDDYNFPNAPTIPLTVADGTQAVYYNTSVKSKGLPTGNWIRILESSTLYKNETGYILYDAKSRPVRTYTKNYLDGYTYTDSKIDAFSGRLEYNITFHKRLFTDTAEIRTKEAFTYSNQDRLLTHTQQIGTTGTLQLIASNGYDELGQLISKKVGNTITTPLQTVNYAYNIRGWLTGINDADTSNSTITMDVKDLFGFQINYNNPTTGKALYNGNISQTFWKTANTDSGLKNYTYAYDDLNRLTNAMDNLGKFNETLTYDKNGNIKTLKRMGEIVGGSTVPDITNSAHFGVMDELAYTYDAGNKLLMVSDNANDTYGFKDDIISTSPDTTTDYTYDANGNMLTDTNKGITANITYNHLNLPTKIVFPTGNITYIYNAAGQKVQKAVYLTAGAMTTTTDYLDGYQYEKINAGTADLKFFPTVEGYVQANAGFYKYFFQYKDHLGNVRLTYQDKQNDGVVGIADIEEENNYYPFGMKQKGYNFASSSSTALKYKYNGKELQDELGLGLYDYGARNYDPALGRWMNIDPLAETSRRFSPYTYALNNPIYFIDPDGMQADDWKTNAQGTLVYDKNLTKENASTQLKKGESYVAESFVAKDQNGSIYSFGKDGNVEKSQADVTMAKSAGMDTDSMMEVKSSVVEEGTSVKQPQKANALLAGVLTLGGADAATPEPSDAIAVPKAVVYGVVAASALITGYLLSDSDMVMEFAKTKPGKAAEVNGAEHTSGARASTANTHEAGQTRKQQVNRDKKRQNPNWRSNK